MLNCEAVDFPLDDKPNIKSQEDESQVDAGILMSIVWKRNLNHAFERQRLISGVNDIIYTCVAYG